METCMYALVQNALGGHFAWHTPSRALATLVSRNLAAPIRIQTHRVCTGTTIYTFGFASTPAVCPSDWKLTQRFVFQPLHLWSVILVSEMLPGRRHFADSDLPSERIRTAVKLCITCTSISLRNVASVAVRNLFNAQPDSRRHSPV